jgi:hypothetical protein
MFCSLGEGALWDKLAHRSSGNILQPFVENYRFLTASHPNISHTLKLFYTFYLKKDTKDSF